MKICSFVLSMVLSLLISTITFAETLTLNTGKVVEGEVIEKTGTYIKVKTEETTFKIPFKMLDMESAERMKSLVISEPAEKEVKEKAGGGEADRIEPEGELDFQPFTSGHVIVNGVSVLLIDSVAVMGKFFGNQYLEIKFFKESLSKEERHKISKGQKISGKESVIELRFVFTKGTSQCELNNFPFYSIFVRSEYLPWTKDLRLGVHPRLKEGISNFDCVYKDGGQIKMGIEGSVMKETLDNRFPSNEALNDLAWAVSIENRIVDPMQLKFGWQKKAMQVKSGMALSEVVEIMGAEPDAVEKHLNYIAYSWTGRQKGQLLKVILNRDGTVGSKYFKDGDGN